MRIAIAGGSGFIGSRLTDLLVSQGHEVLWISRQSHAASAVPIVTWDELPSLEHVHAIVNLTGESINQRWTVAAKARIMQSRVKAATAIARWMEQTQEKPSVVVNASGISIYGTSETETFDESSPHRITDFLSQVTAEWEKAADRIQGVRLVKVRVGVVLDRQEGALPQMMMPYRLGIGGKVGSGKQWLSWIHIEDMVRLIAYCIEHENLVGPVNASAPHPVTNDQFGKAVGKALHRPHWFPAPGFMMRVVFGELSDLLLKGQKVLPAKLLQSGFVFRFPTIEEAMKDITNKER